MGIGNRIKEARNNLGLTQEELAKLLNITKGAVANYEKETSHPKEPIMYKMIEVLKVDANFLFQDMVNFENNKQNVTLTEYEAVCKYRTLDTHGKEVVDFLLEKEYERSCAMKPYQTAKQIDDEYRSELRAQNDKVAK